MIRPFKIDVSQAVLNDLQLRLRNARWIPPGIGSADWTHGTNIHYLRELVRYWIEDFDWRAREQRLNREAQFKTVIDGLDIHFIHELGKGDRPLPLLLTHGYPDSFLRFEKLAPLLTDPAAHGGDPADAFDVIIPSLPGYGFSDKPKTDGTLFKVADLWASLMERLGYEQFGAHGGDWGSTVTEHLARSYSKSVIGIHLTDVPFTHLFQKPKDLSHAEEKFIAESQQWQTQEGAYAMIQSTKPQSLAVGLNDSPVGLAAWLVEKFQRWSDCDGDIESRFTKDELLTHINLYWITESIESSFQLYYDSANAGALRWMSEAFKQWIGSSSVPTGFASFPRDLLPPPREWAERFFNIQRWTKMPRGGHFAALEEPQLLVEDIRAFFKPLRDAIRR